MANRLAAGLLFVALMAGTLYAAMSRQVETEHYVVVFSDGQEYWAHRVIEAAESVWGDLVAAYALFDEYRKIYIYIEDPGDIANGFTIAQRNAVTIYTTSLEPAIRASDNWVRNVVTHELAHVFSIKAADREWIPWGSRIGAFSRFDNPDWNVSFSYPGLIAPPWWIEGAAQYEAFKNGNDRWDSFRDMFLRMAALENDLLDYTEMGSFESRDGFYPEMTYNQGFSLMLYIDSVYGAPAARSIARVKPSLTF